MTLLRPVQQGRRETVHHDTSTSHKPSEQKGTGCRPTKHICDESAYQTHLSARLIRCPHVLLSLVVRVARRVCRGRVVQSCSALLTSEAKLKNHKRLQTVHIRTACLPTATTPFGSHSFPYPSLRDQSPLPNQSLSNTPTPTPSHRMPAKRQHRHGTTSST